MPQFLHYQSGIVPKRSNFTYHFFVEFFDVCLAVESGL